MDAREQPQKFSTHHPDPLFRDGSRLQRAGEAVNLHGRPDEQRRRGARGPPPRFDEPARAHQASQLQHQEGGNVLACGPNQVHQNEWETTMICDLICEKMGVNAADVIPRVVLEDGREAVVVTIGSPEAILKSRPTVVQRCLAKGDVYG